MMKSPVVLITGCSQGGIGYELCRAFQDVGCTVFASARRLEAMEGLSELGIHTLKLDVTSNESVREAVQEVIEKAERIDILVNNAGVSCPGPLAEIPLSDVISSFDTNVFGVLAMVQEVFPHMVNQSAGRVVNIGSIVGYISTPWNGTYCATKSALHAMTDALRLELKPFGISTVLITPGAIKSNIAANSQPALTSRTWNFYSPFQSVIDSRAKASQTLYSTPTIEFARAVVKVVLEKYPPSHFAYGYMADWFGVLQWLPRWIVDFFMERNFGLDSSSAQKALKSV